MMQTDNKISGNEPVRGKYIPLDIIGVFNFKLTFLPEHKVNAVNFSYRQEMKNTTHNYYFEVRTDRANPDCLFYHLKNGLFHIRNSDDNNTLYIYFVECEIQLFKLDSYDFGYILTDVVYNT